MTSFALYRLPYEERCTLIEQADGLPQELSSCAALSGHRGFVVAPFQVAEDHPVLLIRPDSVSVFQQKELRSAISGGAFDCEKNCLLSPGRKHSSPKRSDYSIDFANFHSQLLSGTFRKIVLSRCAVEQPEAALSPLELFAQACEDYPRLFISLVYTPQNGLWLTATPEVLLERVGEQWHTIALAGTMKLSDEQLKEDVPQVSWSTKNIEEQRIVATYIMECLEHFSGDIDEEGPRTVRAANLVHLRSDFTFTLFNNARVGDLLQMLHPTPAVCGLPKREAFDFIIHNEHEPRLCYSGFMGPLDVDSTHLFVSLRCMQILQGQYRLYAGGGLLKESTEQQEWQETEAKLETMRRLLAINP